MRSFSMTSGLVDAMEPEGEDQFFDLSLVQKPLVLFHPYSFCFIASLG
jgi:hypothetical protein